MENRFQLVDAHGRTIRDLRISVTDRCNFRCFYCLPNGEPPLARKETILTFEEIVRVSGIFTKLGIEKIRLTGGEPMLRRGIVDLVSELSKLKPNGLKDLALTTNGFKIPELAKTLKSSGLDRITLSLDSLSEDGFEKITGVRKLSEVIASIDAAKSAGLDPIKVNAVVVRGWNEHEVADLAEFAIKNDVSMRFIEFMPLDSGHEWNREMVVSAAEIRQAIEKRFELELMQAKRGSETAWNYRFRGFETGSIGIIAPVTEAFCGACSRIRLTADGQIRTCLFSTVEHDLREVIRGTDDDREVIEFIRGVAKLKEKSHGINEADFRKPDRTMSFIGG
ncbi:MAG: GTP 3',8-cyclase MoaA [Pyrinomonadaceae bacterium]